jgi:simple sugar transport system permease protein
VIRLERREEVRAWHYVMVPVASVLLALAVGAAFLVITGYDPLRVYTAMLRASFTTGFGLADSLVSATPLALTGLAAAVAFRYRLYNIGGEGQLYVGAIAAAGAGLALGDAPGPLAVTAVIVAGAAGGLVWILLPALARAWLGTSEIITTLLLNYVALFLMRYLIFGTASLWRDPTATNFPQGRPLTDAASFPEWGLTRIHLGLAVALLAAVVVHLLLTRTRVGYDWRVYGDSPAAARYAGIPVRRTIVGVMALSGALAGLAGAGEVAGRAHQLDPEGLAVGFGYAGIIVAALARYNPLAVPLVAVLLGAVDNAGTSLQSIAGARVPIAISTMLQGAILLFVLAGEVLLRYRIASARRGGAGTARDPVGEPVAQSSTSGSGHG